MPGHSFGAMPDSLTIQEVMKAGAASPGGSNGLPPAGEGGGAPEGGAAGAVDPSCEELCKDVKCGECGACSTKPRLCSGCWQQWYCSRMHQTQAWQKHRLQCRPWKLESSPDLGRYMVATRNITQGELLMMDPHLIIGPKMITEPVCLACYMPATGEYNCTKCGFPMCSPDCQDAESHQPECKAISRSGIKIKVRLFGEVNSMYECVMPLRILDLRETNKDLWEKILCLESHLEKRDNTEVMAITQRTVVDILHERLGLIDLEDELIHQVLGIIDTNAFEIRLPETNIQGVYEAASMLEHACIPNTHRTFDADLNLVVRAAVPIKRGEHLTSCYTDVLYTTQQRQEHLLTSKFFTCKCPRCIDPKELGTYTSALKCPTCKEGYLLPEEPISPSCTWRCLKCTEPVDPSYAPGLVSVVQEEAEELESGSPTVASCEAFLNKWISQFHPNHATFLNVKYALLHLYGSDVGYELSQLKPEHILRKEILCRDFVKIADTIAPGVSRLRGSVCYELYQALFYKCKALFKAKLCSPEAAKKIAQEALMWLMECARILSYEPPVQPEGQLGIEAKDEMKQMAKWIREEGWKH